MMKKVVISMMVVAASLIGGNVFAQSQEQKDSKECCDTTAKANVKAHKKDGQKDFRRERPAQFNPFEGMQLTEDQKQRLAVLQKGLGPAMTDMNENSLPENMSEEQKAQIKKDRAAKKAEAKKNYLNGVKDIIGPEQYIVFLENYYMFAPVQQQGQKPNQKSGRPDMKGKNKHDGKRPVRDARDVKPEKK